MAKRKITVTVDEELVDDFSAAPGESLSGLVNTALRAEHERRSRRLALRALLDEWDGEYGPVDETAQAWATAAFESAQAAIVEGVA